MFRHRRNVPRMAAPLVLAVALAATTIAMAQGDGKQTPSTGTQQPATTGASGPKQSSGPTVFRPKETIAPGKPVSFPSDI